MTEVDKETLKNTHDGAAANPHAAAVVRLADAMFRGTIWWLVATTAVGMVAAGVALGTPGVLGALVGGAVATASSLATLLLMRKTAHLGPHFVMAAALGGFMGKMLVLLGVMIALRGATALHPKALAFTMLAAILVAAAAEVAAFRRTKIPTIIVSAGDDRAR